MRFAWNQLQRKPDGSLLLLYRHERIFAEAFTTAAKDVLDVGGWGVLAQRFIEEGKNCTILDLFTEDQLYAERVRALPHVVGDVRNPSCFAPESFDLVTCFETLEHCGDALAAMRSVLGWLRAGGWFVGTIPIAGFCHFEGEPGIQLWSEDYLAVFLRGLGYENVHVEPTGSIAKEDKPCCVYYRAQKSRG